VTHYDYAQARHDHRGEYAEDRHDHDNDYAEKHHRHYETNREIDQLRQDLSAAEKWLRELADDLRDALNRIHVLEDYSPQAQRLQAELDATLADNAAAGYGPDWEPDR
jgi:TATA-binding protein-associated factor Taf7